MSITLPEHDQAAPDAALAPEIDALGRETEPPTQAADGPELMEITATPTIPITALVRNPKNPRGIVRQKPDPDLLASVKADGFEIPFLITRTDDPTKFKIMDGHKRMDVAEHLKMDEVPYAFNESLANDPVGQCLISVVTSQHKDPLTPLETANALFAASEAGGSKTRLAKAYGKKAGSVDQALKVARMPETARRAAEASAYDWDMLGLIALEEFADDAEATARLVQAAEEGTFAFQVERERIERTERDARAEIRAELEAAGVTVLDEEPEQGWRLSRLRDPETGSSIAAEQHATCPGHVAVFETYGEARTASWCTDPHGNGHQDGWAHSSRPTGGKTKDTAARRAVIRGNKDHAAAEAARRTWLRGLIAGAASLEREAIERVSRFVALAVLTAPDPVRKFAGAHDQTERQADLLRMGGDKKQKSWEQAVSKEQWEQAVTAASSRRLVMLQFAAVAAAYEKALTKDVWRTDQPASEYGGADRKNARIWLSFCEASGHTLSPIEKAIVAEESYTPVDLPAAALTDHAGESDEDEADPEDDADAADGSDETGDAQH